MVFGTGDALQAVTVTANTGFLRAAESQVGILTHSVRPSNDRYFPYDSLPKPLAPIRFVPVTVNS